MPSSEDFFNRSLERDVIRERTTDPAWEEEFVDERTIESSEAFDGARERVVRSESRIVDCGHPYRLGGDASLVRCNECSRRQKRAVYVCKDCSFTCPILGVVLCARCGLRGPNGQLYSKKGFKAARRMGLFDNLSPRATAPAPVCTPSRVGLLGRILRWW